MQKAHISCPKEANILGATLLHSNELLHRNKATDFEGAFDVID